MKTVKIIELIDGVKKYKVWHDFQKSIVQLEDIEHVMESLKDKNIKDLYVYVVTFDADAIQSVDWMIQIFNNIPGDLMFDYKKNYEDIETLKEEMLIYQKKGYEIDCPFDGGSGIIEFIEGV